MRILCSIRKVEFIANQPKAKPTLEAALERIAALAYESARQLNDELTFILNYAQEALDALPPGHAERNDLKALQQAATRSAEILRCLVTFTKRIQRLPKQ